MEALLSSSLPSPVACCRKAKEQQEQLVARELHQVKPLEQQLEEQVKAFVSGPPAPFGSAFECGPNCRCSTFVNSVTGRDIGACFEHCQGFPGFIFAPFGPPAGSTDCRCCRDLNQNTGVTTEWYLYSQTLPPPAPSGYDYKCGSKLWPRKSRAHYWSMRRPLCKRSRIHLRPVGSTDRHK